MALAFIPAKPSHAKFLFRDLNSTQYTNYARQYSRAKAGGIRCVYVWFSGTGVLGLIQDIGKGVALSYGKQKLAAFFFTTGTYIMSPTIPMITNATKVVNTAKNLHCLAAFCFECVEGSSNMSFLLIDLMLFGQPIPIGADNRFNWFSNHTDFLL